MSNNAKVKERVLDSSLLAGSLDVDDYAAALLAQHSLEHSNRELEKLEKQVAALKAENAQLHARLESADTAGTAGAKQSVIITENPDRKRKYPEVAALFESRVAAQQSLEPLRRIQSRVCWTPSGGVVDNSSPVSLWYSDVFSDELKVLESVNQKLVEASTKGSTPREQEMEIEIQSLKKDLGMKSQFLMAISAERDELLEWKEQAESELSVVKLERDQLDDIRLAIENELATAQAHKEELLRSVEDLDLQCRSFQELNKALTHKLTVMESLHKEESMRALRAYEYIFHLQQTIQKRKLLHDWHKLAQNTRNRAKADAFRTERLLMNGFSAWRALITERNRVHGAQMKLADRKLGFIMRAWSRYSLECAKKRRAAILFARLKEAQQVRLSFRAWRSQAHALAIASSETETNVDLPALRAAASKAKVPAMIYAASRGMTEATLSLINEGGAVNMKERLTGKTPLHAAAEAGSLSVVEVLLEHGAVPSDIDSNGETALHSVIHKGPNASVDVTLALLRNGADPNYVSPRDGRALLHLAIDAKVPNQLLAELVKYKASVKYQHAATGKTALHAAAARGDHAALDVVLQGALKGSEKWNPDAFPVDIKGQTVLHAACESNSPDLEKCLQAVIEAGFNPDALNEAGEAPIHILCKNPSATPAAVNVLLRLVVDLSKQDKQRNTALHYACQLNSRKVALELVKHGAPVYIVNDDVKCPLDLAAPAFAIELLRAIRVPPISSRYKSALSGMKNCMMCHGSLTEGFLGRRSADHCSRCGRIFCPKCLTKETVITWPSESPLPASSGLLASSLETTSKVISMLRGPSKVCDHCFIICEEEHQSS